MRVSGQPLPTLMHRRVPRNDQRGGEVATGDVSVMELLQVSDFGYVPGVVNGFGFDVIAQRLLGEAVIVPV